MILLKVPWPLQETVKVVQLFFGERLLDLVKGKPALRERNRRKYPEKNQRLKLLKILDQVVFQPPILKEINSPLSCVSKD